jgi:hypothetical protein
MFFAMWSMLCPIDSNYPDARLNLMIEDSNAAFYIG